MNDLTIRKDNKQIEKIKKTAWMTLSEESQKAYQSDYKQFFEFIQKDMTQILPADIIKYIKHLEKRDLKNSTINRKIASLSKMFKIMVIAGEIKFNPVEALKQFKNISRATSRQVNVTLTLKDIRKVTKVTDKTSNAEIKVSLIIRVMASTGLRISEFINIKHKDISIYDKNNFQIRIVGKGNKERFIFISTKLMEEIIDIYPAINDYLFYNFLENKYNRITLYHQIVNQFQKKINKHVRLHLLRHFFITYKITIEKKDIKAVSKYSGHASVSTTLDMYVDHALNPEESKIKI